MLEFIRKFLLYILVCVLIMSLSTSTFLYHIVKHTISSDIGLIYLVVFFWVTVLINLLSLYLFVNIIKG